MKLYSSSLNGVPYDVILLSGESLPESISGAPVESSETEPIVGDSEIAQFSGNAYYTPVYGSEDFYTPWGKSSFDIGFSYLNYSVGIIGGIAILCFVLPYAVRVIANLIDRIQDTMK